MTCCGREALLRNPEGMVAQHRCPGAGGAAWPASAAATAWRPTASSSASGAASWPSPWRSRKPVSVLPARNAGWRRVRTSRSRLVVTPWMRAPASAPASEARGLGRVGAWAMTLASMRVVVRRSPR